MKDSITYESILAAMDALKSLPPVPQIPAIHGNDFCKDVPRMQLSEKVPVTAEFRAEINAWMREFFGVHDVAYQFNDPFTGKPVIVTSKRAAEQANRAVLQYDPAYYEPIFRL